MNNLNIPDKLFINLRIIGKIQKNGRISRSRDGLISLEQETFYQSIKRFLKNDSRKQSTYEINSVINEVHECLYNIINSKYMNKINVNTDEFNKLLEILELLLKELEVAKDGIENLKFTYSDDINITSKLDIILLKVNSTLKDMTNKLQHFKTLRSKDQNEDYVEASEEFELKDIKIDP